MLLATHHPAERSKAPAPKPPARSLHPRRHVGAAGQRRHFQYQISPNGASVGYQGVAPQSGSAKLYVVSASGGIPNAVGPFTGDVYGNVSMT